jgi:hypothetical protein
MLFRGRCIGLLYGMIWHGFLGNRFFCGRLHGRFLRRPDTGNQAQRRPPGSRRGRGNRLRPFQAGTRFLLAGSDLDRGKRWRSVESPALGSVGVEQIWRAFAHVFQPMHGRVSAVDPLEPMRRWLAGLSQGGVGVHSNVVHRGGSLVVGLNRQALDPFSLPLHKASPGSQPARQDAPQNRLWPGHSTTPDSSLRTPTSGSR